ncbi:hypothetical protein PG988_007303 [Apiospora saccharicola]
MVFRILDTIRKHHLTVRYAGRHLFWTAPALYGYYSLYEQVRESYRTGYIGSAREIAAGTKETIRQYRSEQRVHQQQQNGSGCRFFRAREQRAVRAELEERWMSIIHRYGAYNI